MKKRCQILVVDADLAPRLDDAIKRRADNAFIRQAMRTPWNEERMILKAERLRKEFLRRVGLS